MLRIGSHFPDDPARRLRINKTGSAISWSVVRRNVQCSQSSVRQGLKFDFDIGRLETKVMEAFAMFIQVLAERVILRQRLNKLQLQVTHVKVREPHISAGNDLAKDQRKAKHISVEPQCLFGITDDYRDVVKFAKKGSGHDYDPEFGEGSESFYRS